MPAPAHVPRVRAWPIVVALIVGLVVVAIVGLQARHERATTRLVERLATACSHLGEHVLSVERGDLHERGELAEDLAAFQRTFERIQHGTAEGAAGAPTWSDPADRRLLDDVRRLWERAEPDLVRLAAPGGIAARVDRVQERLAAVVPPLATKVEAFADRQRRRSEARQVQFLLVAWLALAVCGGLVFRFLVRSARLRERAAAVLADALLRAEAAETAPAGLAISDGELRLTWCNEAFARRTHEPPTRLWGQPVLAAIATELDTTETRRALRLTLEQGEFFERELVLAAPGGRTERVWVGARAPRAGDPTAGVAWMVCAVVEDAPSEDAFASGALFDEVLRATSNGFLLLDAEGRIQRWNAAAERMLGSAGEPLSGRDSLDSRWRIVREDGSPWPVDEQPAMVALHTGRSSAGQRMGVHRPDGRLVWISVDAMPLVRPGERTPWAVVTLFADVTAARHAEAVARKLTRAVEQNPVGVVITDATAAIEYVNPQFERLSGYTLAELLGRNPRVLASGETPRGVYAEMWAALRAGQDWRGIVRNRRSDGEHYLADLAIFPLRDERGRVSHYVAFHQDAEAARADRSAAEFARNRDAEDAGARAQFLQVMSRELLRPLESITRTADDLLRCGPERGPLAGLKQIRHTAEQMQSVIHQLFDLSWMEGGGAPRPTVPFRLRALVREVLADLARDGRPADDVPRVQVDSDVPDVWTGDAGALRQLLWALAGDAALDARGLEVEVRVLGTAAEGERRTLGIEVLRHGPVLPTARRMEIERALASPTSPASPTQLGSSLAARLAMHLGGTLRFESRGEACDAWWLQVPLQSVASPAWPEPRSENAQSAHVLVMEARAAAASGLRARLESLGCTVTMAASVADAPGLALDALRRGEPCELVVVEGRGGVLDPFAAVQALRGEGRGLDLPVLVLTDTGARGDADRCRSLGVRGYLAVPFGDLDLEEAVNAVRVSRAGDPLVTRHALREVRAARRVLVVGPGDLAAEASALLARAGYDVMRERDPRGVVDAMRRDRPHAVIVESEIEGADVPARMAELTAARAAHGAEAAAQLVLGGRFDARWVNTGVDAFVPVPLQLDVLLGALQPLTGERASGGVEPAARRGAEDQRRAA